MLTRRTLILSALAAVPVAAFMTRTTDAGTSKSPVYKEAGIAIDGTDPLSYFNEGRPIAGDASITHDWNGATWRFVSAANRDAFAADPEAYAPQFGGYCAWAVSQGYTASTIPEAWKIVDGKLYLNFNRRIQRRWERDIPGHIAAGNANWPGVLA